MMRLDLANRYAERMREKLLPYCERIEIAGSVRRRKPDGIKDVELVIIPAESTAPQPSELFATGTWQPLLVELDRLVAQPTSRFVRGHAWGPKYRKLIFCGGSGVTFDLFFVDRATWGVQFTLRTGPADFSRLLVTQQSEGGALPDGWRVRQGRVESPGLQRFDTPEEADFFDLLRLPFWEPRKRSELLLQRHLVAH